MEYTNASNLPKAIERAVANDPYSSKGSNISATRLIAPPRIRVLEMRNWDLLKEDVSDKIFALLGQSVHHIIERSKQRIDLSERRLFYKDDKITNGWTLSGSFDYLERDGRLIDFNNLDHSFVLEICEEDGCLDKINPRTGNIYPKKK